MTVDVTFWAAFLAGILSFFSPCILPMIPVYGSHLAVSVVGRTDESGRINWGISLQALVFIAGFTLVFVSLGAASSAIGKYLTFNKVWLLKIGGIFVMLMGLNLLGLLPLKVLARHWLPLQKERSANSLRSFFLGTAFALGWTPCIGPVLASVLTVAATGGSILKGSLLLVAYSLGMAIPFLVLCLTFDRYPSLQRVLGKYSRASLVVSGILLTLLGALMFFNKLPVVTAYLSF